MLLPNALFLALFGATLFAPGASPFAPGVSAAPTRAAQEEEPVETRPFALPDTRTSRALSERAAEHLAAKRWIEAATDLQKLIEEHDRDLLGATRPAPLGRPSQQVVHPGAGRWAEQQLFALGPEARRAYRERYEAVAREALGEALRDGMRAALARVAVRWPITDAAERAWWALGDLELELGNLDQARLAWERAVRLRLLRPDLRLATEGEWLAALAQAVPDEASDLAGLRSRLRLAAASLDPTHELARPQTARRPSGGQMRLPGPGEGTVGTPGAETDGWQVALPAHPFGGGFRSNFRLHAVRAGWKLFVSTSLELIAIDTLTGETLWSSGEAPGWDRLGRNRDEYFRGVSQRRALIAPAVAAGIVVVPLQIPISLLEHRDFNSISILRRIPDRRLFAYEAATGRELWNHMPPPDWDGESGTFSQRMMVAGPPVIAGSRVLVPTYRMDGRIDYNVACYALDTGELLWSTPVISGQRELNMFSRPEFEFCAPPLRVEGDRIIALTQLGAVAALDLFSGRLLWETLYEQVPLPQRRGHSAPEREPTWENAPPVVAAGVVVATPSDSRDLVGLDLETGAMLWSLAQSSVNQLARGRVSRIDLLLGADERRIYLSGQHIVALEAPGGLYHTRPVQTAWVYDGFENDAPQGWPVLLRDRVVVATPTQRHEIHRHSGARARAPIPWRGGRSGNLLIDGGMLYTLDGRYLNGYFEWRGLLDLAAADYRAQPPNEAAAIDYSRLLAVRGETLRREGRSDQARALLEEAHGVLLPLLDADEPDPRARLGMHEILRAQAQVAADLTDTAGAVRALRAARALAPDAARLRDSLLEEAEVLAGVDDDARLGVLALLETECAGLDVPCALATPGAIGLDALVPAVAGEDVTWRLSVPLFATLERTGLHAARGAARLEFEALHRLLSDWPAVQLPGGTVAEFAGARIAAMLAAGARDAYAPYEQRATELLRAASSDEDPGALERIARLYPHSNASREAHDALLDIAVAQGDIRRAAAILSAELQEAPNPTRPTEREARLLLALAAAADQVGNGELARGLLEQLEKTVPDLVSEQPPHGARTVRELAAERRVPPPDPARAAASFSGTPREIAVLPGRYEPIGEAPPAAANADGPRIMLFGRSEASRLRSAHQTVALEAFSDADPTRALWDVSLPPVGGIETWQERVGMAEGRIVVATERSLFGLERETGAPLWTWTPGDRRVVGVRVSGGVAVAISTGSEDDRLVLTGVELALGAVLWQIEASTKEYSEEAVCGSGRLVLLPQPYAASTMLVFDLFTGRKLHSVDLRRAPQRMLARAAWIEDGRIVLPWFLIEVEDERNHVVAFDLDTGTLAWEVHFDRSLGGGKQLHAIVQTGAHTILVLKPASSAGGVRGVLAALDTRIGGVARLGNVELDDDHVPIGSHLSDRRRLRLDEPFLFLSSRVQGNDGMRLTAVHLPFGVERWRWEPPFDDLYTGGMPLPAVGRDVVALVVGERGSRRPVTHLSNLVLLGRHDGQRREIQLLDPAYGRSDEIQLVPLGNALLVTGQQMMRVMR